MKAELKTPMIIVVVVIAVLAVGMVLMKAGGTGNLDQGQVKYTPGIPPWAEKDPSKAGPGAAPGGGSPAGGSPSGAAPAPVSQTGGAAAPPGMSAPSRG